METGLESRKNCRKEITISVSEDRKVKDQQDLFGIFFEDLNHAADGGLYGEMLRNRSFEFSQIDNKSYHAMTAWEEVSRGDSVLQAHVEQWDSRNPANPHYLVLEVLSAGEGAGVRNEGYHAGLFVESGKEYCFTCFCRTRGIREGFFKVRLESADGSRHYAEKTLQAAPGKWGKLECSLEAEATDTKARLAILMMQPMTLELDMVSLFPAETFRMRKNGLRKDIAEMLAELKPRFMRFPGGCLAHIGSLDARDRNAMYRWKNTLGEVWERPAKRNSWQYNQTLGLGFYEFFLFCEDIGAEPLPVIAAGNDPHNLRAASLEDMQEWIGEALDLIEFANGDISTKWGSIRGKMGHPESFRLKYLAIGNEEVGDEYYERYEIIAKAVKAAYPDILLINSAGPAPAGSEFDKGWEQAGHTGTAYADEHFYQCPEWFVANARRYEAYPSEVKAFLGEYASHDMTWWNALAESAFMIGMEKAKGIGLACYAPLLNNVDYTNWKTDLIHYDNHRVYGTPSYYVQKLFMNYQGEELVLSESDMPETEEAVPKLCGYGMFLTDRSQVHIMDMAIRNEDTGEEICLGDFRVSGEEKGKSLPDIQWENYTISFLYKREAGGTVQALAGSHSSRLEFAKRDEANCLQLIFDGWERTISLNGMVNGSACGFVMTQAILEKGRPYACEVQVRGNLVRAIVDGKVLEHECKNPQPDEIYYSAVLDINRNLIVKLANLTSERKYVRIRTRQEYRKLQAVSISGCGLGWRNSFEEPKKVSPKEQAVALEGRSDLLGEGYAYEMPEYALVVLDFIK